MEVKIDYSKLDAMGILENNQIWWATLFYRGTYEPALTRGDFHEFEELYAYRMPWKRVTPYMLDRIVRELGHTTNFEQPKRGPLARRVQGVFGRYSKLVRHRIYHERIPSQATMEHAKRLMRLSLGMEEEYHK